MNVLVDTSVWSIALQREQIKGKQEALVDLLEELIQEARVVMIGPVRQELLSGISQAAQFRKIQKSLSAFEDLPITTEDYERAAQMFNLCRKKGVQGSHIDFLICAVSERQHLCLFTSDKDFVRYADHIPLMLYRPPPIS